MEVTMEEIAEVAHEANRAYCLAIGDDSQLPWADAPQWQRDSCLNGVRSRHANPGMSDEEGHVSWLRFMEKEGWKYGPVKNPETKEHPYFVPYADLSKYQRAKDAIFRGVVMTLFYLGRR